jgi:hypothetical protein
MACRDCGFGSQRSALLPDSGISLHGGKNMRKLLVLGVLMAAGAAIAAPSVSATQPTFAPSPNTNYTDTTSCPFPVSVQFIVNDETAITFTSGTTIVKGPLFAKYSANGKSITLNISGPGKIGASRL